MDLFSVSVVLVFIINLFITWQLLSISICPAVICGEKPTAMVIFHIISLCFPDKTLKRNFCQLLTQLSPAVIETNPGAKPQLPPLPSLPGGLSQFVCFAV